MKKLLNLCLLGSFLLGYLQWGKDQHLFIWQAEAEIFLKARHNFSSVFHPFIFIPFLGQLLLLVTIFQKKMSRRLTLVGLACLSVLMLLLFIIGLLIFNVSIIASTLPFLITGLLVIKLNWKTSVPNRAAGVHNSANNKKTG